MRLLFKDGAWDRIPRARQFNAYAKVDGKLARWEAQAVQWQGAFNMVKQELGMKHRGPVMVVIK